MNREQQLLKDIASKQAELEKLLKEKESLKYPLPFDPLGVWKVTTEGDCEGRSTRNLGTYEGHVLDIAKQLAGQAYYQLDFRRVTPKKVDSSPVSTKQEVNFRVADHGTKFGDQNDQLRLLGQHVRDGETLARGQYYGAAKLTWEVK
ncbi:hypothetical protein Blue_109 [Bacillus phage Deep Blue]|uniref:Uncharacterized protein n=1 Tax=Bacillus phage Deep Blue TaxID=1792245 RepID=A0A140HLS0_9CAUD|nr:hypothetical protein Blue_109 [Bacillus phage Deep Blue]AMO25932.1 hypothetical protein Blue_109 [Bacillus phage Deep Blue]